MRDLSQRQRAARDQFGDGEGVDPGAARRRLRARRHHRHRAVARHRAGRGHREGRQADPRRRARRVVPLPRRHVPGGRRGRPPRRARRQPPRRRRGGRHRRALPGADRGRAAERLARTSPARTSRCATASRRCCRYARDAGVPLAIEPLHPMYAADRACVNTLGARQRSLRRAGRGARRRGRRLSRLVGSRPGAADRARRQAHPHLSRLRLAGADHAICCSTAACRATA